MTQVSHEAARHDEPHGGGMAIRLERRELAESAAAMGVTYGIGSLIGASGI